MQTVKDYVKRQTFWSLPVYSGDVSGVCSALYELGGMVVMHDPSGCNSTYNTHDEIRWMERESLIFLSGLTDRDAITGNDQKLLDDILDAGRVFLPAFVAVAASPVPWLIGTDLKALCKKAQESLKIPCFSVSTNAMHDYTVGAGQAFLSLAVAFFSKEALRERKERGSRENRPLRLCALGMTPLDFTVREQRRTLEELAAEEGFELISVWALGDDLPALLSSLEADVNLLLSSAGLPLARYLYEQAGIPYVAGLPTGAFASSLFESLRRAAKSGKSEVPYLEILSKEKGEKRAERCFAGEPVAMGSLAAAKALSDHRPADLVCLTETREGLIADGDAAPEGEEEIRAVLGEYPEVTGDPMLFHVCREGVRFHRLPSLAYSGRVYLDEIPALVGRDEVMLREETYEHE